MKKNVVILIADRNPHVREFLRREMMPEGYEIRLANSAREALKWVFGPEPLHLVIIDPDLPDADELEILKRLEGRIPALPIIIHSFSPDYARTPEVPGTFVFVEKMGKSIERLKKMAEVLMQQADPSRSKTPQSEKLRRGCALHETGQPDP